MILWFFSSHLEQSLHHLFNTITSFSKLSGYKINKGKSAILFLKHSERVNPPVQTPFKIVRDSLIYLGIRITPKINDLVEANYNPESVSESINRWSMLPISMIGRINILKMNVLPKFTSFIPFLLVLLFIFFQRKACSVISFGTTDGLDFAYLCFISPMIEEAWNSQTSNGIIGLPNLQLLLVGSHKKRHIPGWVWKEAWHLLYHSIHIYIQLN